MTGLKRRVANQDAKQKLGREISQPFNGLRGTFRSDDQILEEALSAFKKRIEEPKKPKMTHDA